MSINVKSEVTSLKKVLLHRPGQELENLIPEDLDRLLFDGIPDLEIAKQEHDAFAKILCANGVEVVYLHELVAVLMKNKAIKEKFLNQFIKESGIKSQFIKDKVYEWLDGIANHEEMIRKTMAGVNKNELPQIDEMGLDYLNDDYPFIIDPMPNLYFTRDPFASIGNSISLNKMQTVVRSRETIYTEYIFNYHPEYKNIQQVYDRSSDYSIEGGDILVLNERVLAIGISQRTQIEAIEKLAKKLFFETKDNQVEVILAFDIPKVRAYMHLDTIFTQIDKDKFLIDPQFQESLSVLEIKKENNKILRNRRDDLSLEKILTKHLGYEIELIQCGDGDYVISQREQWNGGLNTLCIKPGEVIVYSKNSVTNKLLEKKGIKIHMISASELSRGHGGPRCMSTPLIRE